MKKSTIRLRKPARHANLPATSSQNPRAASQKRGSEESAQPSSSRISPLPSRAGGNGRDLLKDRAYSEIKTLIQSGELEAGEFLSERQLSERLGMSKTPIRAALERLEGLGLVSVSPQQGIVVRGLSLAELLEVFEVRMAIEPYVVERLSGRATALQLAELDNNLLAQHAAVEAGDADRAAALDVEFHSLLAELSGNREIQSFLARSFDKLYREIVRITRQGADRLASSYREHVTIVTALRARDGVAAAERMREHLRYGQQFLTSQ